MNEIRIDGKKLGKKSMKLIAEMEQHDLHFDENESHRGYYRFTNAYGAMWFETWSELDEYLKNVCWD
ncbi:MAG: hypothetical protein RSC06_14725 [Clostridia bacterium]